ncbi:response regulator [Anaerocolumna sp. MB42-C2]|uniref:response regulator n=1 Tax=Anaerocolumna sp. MB42-C2 TaxID=3070997 RepID=UPI0027DF7064|nr:response regulator [Anaerocolumna sp. MB42-C2]WMJ88664.1 response regulator [Anaerocolumna sp. MB42-C2]
MYKVLVVDDEPIAVESVVYMINKNFDSIDIIGTSRSGKDAIEKAYKFHPDIVFMDINMPGMNGLDVMKEIRLHIPNVSFIVISAYDFYAESEAMGIEEYILKPVKETKFIETLNKALKKIIL